MTKAFSRRNFIRLALAGAATPVWADAPIKSLRPVLRPDGIGTGATAATKAAAPGAQALIQASGISGKVSFAVARTGDGRLLEQHQAATGLPPASVTKALTALYALRTLGPTHRFNTKLIAVGPVKNGVIDGDLVLRGGGDPTLATNDLAELARGLKAAGIREVRGRFLVWGGALPGLRQIDKKQPDHAGYNPAVSGLSLNYNRVHFEWKRTSGGYGVTMDARSNKYRPEVSMAKMKIVNRQVPVYTYQNVNGEDRWTVAKGALGKGGARWLPVRQPEIYAGQVFATLARAHGIVLKQPQKTASAPHGQSLVTHQSAALRDILKGMLKYSTNLTAEMVGMATSLARGARVTSTASSAAAMNGWAAEALGMSQAALVDHSGLGEGSRLRADELVHVLAQSAQQRDLKPILKEVWLKGGNGKINKTHPLTVRAKTGTLHFVSGLAGYVSASDGTELAFAIFEADMGARSRLIGADRERPKGARSWNSKAKKLQQKLLERWGVVYSA